MMVAARKKWSKEEWLQMVHIASLVVIALLGVWTAQIANGTHDLVNSRMTELLELTRKSSEARGQKIEQDKK